MLEFLTLIATNPYADLVAAFSCIAAIAFLIFFWGFSGYILAHGDAEHQQNARRQMVQGIALFVTILVLWEVIRWFASLFT
jgi:hypothetical protein